eukprot:TRINITY_DN5155_c0_g2_i1.p2 TRINITY_DN5155_c0_g2~~TRINITY_DN5155_c0_g2_i1.p2  ORF type:complete len:148 (-),score=58.97 TRINITY_DN5155_c0_g2_i1:122-565(-)
MEGDGRSEGVREWLTKVLHRYTVGSVFYALYFVISYPFFFRVEEDGSMWTWRQIVVDSFAAGMIVLCLLDLWKLALGKVDDYVHDGIMGLCFLLSGSIIGVWFAGLDESVFVNKEVKVNGVEKEEEEKMDEVDDSSSVVSSHSKKRN